MIGLGTMPQGEGRFIMTPIQTPPVARSTDPPTRADSSRGLPGIKGWPALTVRFHFHTIDSLSLHADVFDMGVLAICSNAVIPSRCRSPSLDL